jgi:hypothetical protein
MWQTKQLRRRREHPIKADAENYLGGRRVLRKEKGVKDG